MALSLKIKSYIKNIILNNQLLAKVLARLYSSCSNRIHMAQGNNLEKDYAFLLNTKIYIAGKGNVIIIGPYSRLKNCLLHITGDNNSILVGQKASLLNAELHIEDNNNTINIGDNTTISGRTHLACIEGCTISVGNDCMFSSDVTFRTGDSHSIIDSLGVRINRSKDIIIGNHVWVGNNTIVLKGVVLGDNCIVATGSVVTAPFSQPNIIIGGNPAKLIKENTNWLRARI